MQARICCGAVLWPQIMGIQEWYRQEWRTRHAMQDGGNNVHGKLKAQHGQIVKNGLHRWCCCYSSVTCNLVGHSQVKLRCESGQRHEAWVHTQQHS